MSVPVDLHALQERVAEYGPAAFLVTVNDDGTAHVVSVAIRHEHDRLFAAAGRSTRANLGRNPALTLLWPAPPGAAYSMLVDATASSVPADDQPFAIEPRSAILHRVADATVAGPSCLPLDAAT